MDFAYSDKTEEMRRRVTDFFEDHILPRNGQWHEEVEQGNFPVSFMADLKALAKSEGLWNMFLPGLREDEPGTRLSNTEFFITFNRPYRLNSNLVFILIKQLTAVDMKDLISILILI